MRWMTRFGQAGNDGERGASLVEYALLIALIAIVCFSAITFFGGSNKTSLDRSFSCIEGQRTDC
jgi:Flp pilus assembly pilin Flp